LDDPTIRIRTARRDEAPLLSALARRSKGHWGYSETFLDACRDELAVSAAMIDAGATFVLEASGSVVGFYTLDVEPGGEVELEHLFVEPDLIGCGHGRRLMRHALARAHTAGGRTLRVQSDPHAAAFYRALGGRAVGEEPSASIPGRVLPVFVLDVG